MNHIPIACFYGFMSLLSYVKDDGTKISFQMVSIMIGWIMLLFITFTVDWFDKTTNGYFMIMMLLFIAARLAKYNTPEIAQECSYVAVGIALGVVVNSFHKEHLDTGLFLLSILLLEVINMNISTNIKSVDMEQILPTNLYPIDDISSLI